MLTDYSITLDSTRVKAILSVYYRYPFPFLTITYCLSSCLCGLFFTPIQYDFFSYGPHSFSDYFLYIY